MKGKLIKKEGGYCLIIPGESTNKFIASIDGMYVDHILSLKNCQAIENGYDLDELITEELNKLPYTKHLDDGQYNDGQLVGFELGAYWAFQKSQELLGDKKFSINEVVELCKILMSNPFEKCGKTYQELTDSYIQSLQQTEWEVEIVMKVINHGTGEDGKLIETVEPKLDQNGCLILKRSV